jgi:NitT/TauT family transport system substrate-binding protein
MKEDPEIAVLMPADPLLPGYAASVIAYGARLLDDQDLGRRFAVAFLKGVRQYLKGKTERNVALVSEYTRLEPELVRKICWTYSPPDGKLNVDSLMSLQSWLAEQGHLDRMLSPEELVDTRFAEYARALLATEGP